MDHGHGHGHSTLLLDVLSAVPHLASICAEQHVLRELRSISSEARRCSGGLVTSMTLDSRFHSDTPLSALEQSSLLSLLSGNRLSRVVVVLQLKSRRE